MNIIQLFMPYYFRDASYLRTNSETYLSSSPSWSSFPRYSLATSLGCILLGNFRLTYKEK